MESNHPLSQKRIREQALNWDDLGFWGKSKNSLLVFYIVVLGLTPLIMMATGEWDIYAWFGMALYAIFFPFLFLNHRWAMIVLCLLYLADKIAIIVMSPASAISAVLFGVLVVCWTYKAVQVATELKKIRSGKSPDLAVFE